MNENAMFKRITINEVVNSITEYLTKENMKFKDADDHLGYATVDWTVSRKEYIQDLDAGKRMAECFLTNFLRKYSVINEHEYTELINREDGFVDIIVAYIPDES